MIKLITKLNKLTEKYSHYIYILLLIIFMIIYGFMSLRKHYQFQTYGWDLGVFDHGIWQWSQFKIPYSSFHDLPWLADHFHPILLFIAPLYWVIPGAKTLVVVQALITVLGTVPLYLISKRVVKHHAFSLVISLGYLLFYSLQWHTFSGFHELAFMPVTLGFALYFWETKNTKFYWVFVILLLMVKEEMGFLLASVGLWQLVTSKRKKQAILTILLGVSWTFIMVYLIMPAIGGGKYRHSGFGKHGDGVLEVVLNIISNPILIFQSFVDSKIKLDTMFVTFWPWGFLPLFAPPTLIPIIEQFASRFLDYEKTIRWTPYFAYSLPMATLMAWGSIYGFRNIRDRIKFIDKDVIGWAGSFVLLTLIVLETYLLHAPINSVFKKQFYLNERWTEDNHKALLCIPDDASVSAMNSLVPWLSIRQEIKVFPEGIGYDYIVLDIHKGQSENSFHFLGRENTISVYEDLVERSFYKVDCKYNDAIVLKKVENFSKDELNYPFDIEVQEK